MKQLIQCMGMMMLLFGLSSRVSAQITLVKDGKATSRIVLVEKNEVNEQAATLLQDFVKRISQATLPIADSLPRYFQCGSQFFLLDSPFFPDFL